MQIMQQRQLCSQSVAFASDKHPLDFNTGKLSGFKAIYDALNPDSLPVIKSRFKAIYDVRMDLKLLGFKAIYDVRMMYFPPKLH